MYHGLITRDTVHTCSVTTDRCIPIRHSNVS